MFNRRWSFLYVSLVLVCLVLFAYMGMKDISHSSRVESQQIPKFVKIPVVVRTVATAVVVNSSKVDDCETWKPIFKVRPMIKKIPFRADISNNRRIETAGQRMASFQEVYEKHLWGAQEPGYKGIQGSGAGSSVHYAQLMMKVLDSLINMAKKVTGKSKVSFLDIPCGDMVWIPKFLENRNDINYTGMDIVPELIKSHKTRFANRSNWSFRHGDIVNDPLKEQFDIIFCRHMLQHLSTADALKVLKHFSDSGSRFLLTTSWLGTKANIELPTFQHGRFRRMNLELPPFSLVPPLCFGRDWPKGPYEKQLYTGLWSLPLEQIDSSEFTSKGPIRLTKSKAHNDFEVYAISYEN
ncbi:uncharacterized protein LOC141913102 [Tubulanus polymorphus]|uniref:uncharacterized protein LOC141913102 n=1 Tax=Tubulanus polymorphus TaxID=672921 RepID=UPI003DA42557